MVDVNTVVVSVVAWLSIFLQPGIIGQPTTDHSSNGDSCAELENRCEFETVENIRLRGVLESKRQEIEALENEVYRLWEKESQSFSVTATFVNSLERSQHQRGIIKVDDKIYVLHNNPNRMEVYENGIDFRFVTEIALESILHPVDIVYSSKSKCVYISESRHTESCIYMMNTTGEHQLTKWLIPVTRTCTISLSNEGHLLVLREFKSLRLNNILEVYSLNAALVRKLYLPQDIKDPRHVVQTSAGNFIILHQLIDEPSRPFVITQLTSDRRLLNRFPSRNQLEKLSDPRHLSLDPDNNLLFVADYGNNRVVLLDSNVLTWKKVLLSQKADGIHDPFRLFYDTSKKHLFVAQHSGNVSVYKLN